MLSFLDPKPGDIVVDATLGGGGHSLEILKRILPGGKLIGIDRDIEAIERTRNIFRDKIENVILVNGNFGDLAKILNERKIGRIDGAVFDLGFSSFQVDDPSRGFSFLNEGPLDMRFDRLEGITAYDVVNSSGKEELSGIIKEYGEERHSKAIAAAIVTSRKNCKIRTTRELSKIIEEAVGKKYSNQRIHPSCRTFQAIRIHVNSEMASIEKGVEGALSVLSSGKRICVISFHSLEDRIVKNVFRRESKFKKAKIITKKPVVPGNFEIRNNPRARSAKLRVAEGVR